MKRTSGITESEVRSHASEKSFDRGKDYFQKGAIFNAWKQGDRLLASASGSEAAPYKVQARLEEGKVLSASCTCPYDWGGYCKHIVALLLTYIHRPEVFEERVEIGTLLAGFSREELVGLIEQVVEQAPDLYDWLALYINARQAADQEAREIEAGPAGAVGAETLAKARRFDEVYRREVRRILQALADAAYEDFIEPVDDELVEGLEKIANVGRDLLERNAPASALVALQALVEDVGDVYEDLDDSHGEIAAILESLDMPLAEAILSVELSKEERDSLAGKLAEYTEMLAEYDSPGLGTALAALEHGWQAIIPGILDLEAEGDEGEDWAEPDWNEDTELYTDEYYARRLQEARFNVLERQGRMEEYLQLCEQTGQQLRKLYKLVELGRVGEAVQAAEGLLDTAEDRKQFVQILRQGGYAEEADRFRKRGPGRGRSKSRPDGPPGS